MHTWKMTKKPKDKKDAVLCQYLLTNITDAKCMYNTANFYIRNIMAGIQKSLEERTVNDTEDYKQNSIFAEPLYNCINLSSDEGFEKHTEMLENDNVSLCDVYYISTELKDHTKINLCEQLPGFLVSIRIPVIFIVDSFSVLKDTRDWLALHYDLPDIAMNIDGSTKLLKDIMNE